MVYIIGNVVVGEGCQVKINGNTPVTFGVTGIQLVPETAPFNIPVGWSIITYLRTSPGDMVTLMAPITAANLYKRIS